MGNEIFIKELAWRDFYNMIYYFHPNQHNEEIIEKYRCINWEYDEGNFIKWKSGLTGFPIIDAAMRQLSEEGWMHNRLRMITASFLIKDLLIDWRLGEKYFSEMLIDYDIASNIGGWQWAASVGTDAVPYFRIFNPITQSKKYDPELIKIETTSYAYFFSSLNSFYESCLKKGLDIYFLYGEILTCFDTLLNEFSNIDKIY